MSASLNGNNKGNTNDDDDGDMHVVVEQSYLKTEEVFVYRIPPMMTSGGHHADDWNLAKPLATCSLHVKRRDDDLFLQLLTDRPKVGGPPGSTEQHLFAQCHIQLDLSSSSGRTKPMEYWVETVTDSSRYFVIRISDDRTGREAFIGMGFRERSDATNFKMCLQEYENALKKEQKAQQIQQAYEQQTTNDTNNNNNNDDPNDNPHNDSDNNSPNHDSFSKLSLKEGEKIHIKIKGMEAHSRPSKPSKSSNTNKSALPILIRKPPPPASASSSSPTPTKTPIVIDTHQIVQQTEKNNTTPLTTPMASVDASSTMAVTEINELNDDEWGDFESGN